jgi:hypothetical protein
MEIYRARDLSLVRTIEVEAEAHCFAFIKGTDLLVLTHWNSSVVTIMDVAQWKIVQTIDLQEFAPYRVLEIETVFTAHILAFDYLLLGLSNGMLLAFNLYPSIFGQGL